MPKIKVLNWYNKPELVRGLRKFLSKREIGENYRAVVTMRYGPKWANKLNPGDKVAISISDNPEKPNIIGYASVGDVKKTVICFLGSEDSKKDLRKNIGTARTWQEVWKDMKSVYGEDVSFSDVISVIELLELELEPAE